MRILWFTASASLAGEYLQYGNVGCSWIQSLESELKKIGGIQLGVVFTWNEKILAPFTLKETSYYPVANNRIKGKIKDIYSRWTHKIVVEENVEKYINIIEKFAPDIIHIFGTENDFGLLISKINIPCIIHLQGNLTVIQNNKWYSGLTKAEVFKYSKKWPLFKGHGLFHDYFYNKKMAEREQEVFRRGRFFMGRTDWDRRIATVLSPKAEYFHCDEIMRSEFYLNHWKSHSERNKYVILSTVRRNIFKGLETVYECKKILDQKFSEYNFIWKIAGIEEKDEIVYLIQKKYKGKFKNINIELLGGLNEDGLINEMLLADVYVHPSHIENSSNSICEAMLIGMPVIATYVGGTSNMLQDKKEGILIQDGDSYSMAGAIIELIQNKNYADNLGKNARTRAIIRHNPDKIVKDVLDIYTRVLEKSNKIDLKIKVI